MRQSLNNLRLSLSPSEVGKNLALLIPFVVAAVVFTVSPETLRADDSAPACPMGEGYEFAPELSDEFNGDALDDSKWWDFNPAWRGRKPALYSRKNVSVADGALRLTASVAGPDEVGYDDQVRGYGKFWASSVKSKAKSGYGYYEARCKSMHAALCNAFWLYDPLSDRPDRKYVEGDVNDEIDIFEFCGNPKDKSLDRFYFATIHHFATPYLESIINTKKLPIENPSYKQKMDFDFWTDFHVYGFAWTPTDLRWYVDGQEVCRHENDAFRRPLHIVFDCEVIPWWFGEPDPADLPSSFEIDYIRFWKLTDAQSAESEK